MKKMAIFFLCFSNVIMGWETKILQEILAEMGPDSEIVTDAELVMGMDPEAMAEPTVMETETV